MPHILGRVDRLIVDGKESVTYLHAGRSGVGAFVEGGNGDAVSPQLQAHYLAYGDEGLHGAGCYRQYIKKIDSRYQAENFSFHFAVLLLSGGEPNSDSPTAVLLFVFSLSSSACWLPL
jgi:hypothetical protein